LFHHGKNNQILPACIFLLYSISTIFVQMKKIFVFLLVLFALSCDDGNFDVPEFNFSNESIDDCGDLVLFKINSTESLVIEINEDNTNDSFFTEIKANKVISLIENGSNRVTYRTFDIAPTSNYFCQNIPPTTPTVINEWILN